MRLATICARAGSKRLPGKNARELDGVPLLSWAISGALQSECFDSVIVSTDDRRCFLIAAEHGFNDASSRLIVTRRTSELCRDESGKVPAIRHALMEAERIKGLTFDQIVDLDVTAPLRTIDDIRGFCAKLDTIQHGGLVSVTPSRRSPYFNQVELRPDGTAKLVRQLTGEEFIRSQDVPQTYDLNASMTGWTRKYLMEGADHPVSWNTHIYEMPPERSWDIDTEHDWRIVEFLMGEQRENVNA